MFMLAIITYFVQYAAALSIKSSAKECIRLAPDGSANDVLCNILNNGSATQISLDGFVSKRRAIGKSLVFLDIVPSDVPQLKTDHQEPFNAEDFASTKPVQVLMRRDIWKTIHEEDGNAESQYDLYQKIIQPGVYCSLMGEAGPSRLPNEALLFCHSASYTLPNDNPQHLRNVVKFARDGLLDLEELCAALPCSDKEEILQMLNTEGNAQHSNGECAVEILSRFPRNFLLNPSKLMGNSNSEKVSLLPPVPFEYRVPAGVSCGMASSFSGNIATVEQVLEELKLSQPLQAQHTPLQQFTLSGFVQNRRRFQNSTTVVELVKKFSSSAEASERIADIDMTTQNSETSKAWGERIHIVIDPNVIGEEAEIYGNILAAGSQVVVTGHIARADKSGMAICWTSKCRLQKSSWKLNAVRQILELLHESKIGIEEAADALSLEGGYAQAEHIANRSTSSTDRQWMATEISQSLQGEHSRYGKITSQMTKALDEFAHLRKKYPIEAAHQLKPSSTTTSRASHDSRWERAKKPQLAWMIGQISHVLTSHPDYGQRTLKIVDIGGGKGLLSNLLAETFKGKVDVQVVDISRSATNNGMMRARRRGIENVRYHAQDASTIDVEGVDVVVALHACGALSDVALGHAVSQGAGFVICPW